MSKRRFDQVLAAVRASGIRITDAEEKIIRRRLARPGAMHDPALSDGVGPDPLAGAEADPVLAVQHVLDERVGIALEGEPRPSITGLFDADADDTPEHGEEPEPPRTIDQPIPRDADPGAEKRVDPDAPQPPGSDPSHTTAPGKGTK